MAKKKKNGTSLFSIIIVLIIAGLGGARYINSANSNEIVKYIININQRKHESFQETEIPQSSYEIPAFSNKRGGQIIAHKGYTLSYNADYKTPQWVGWQLTKEKTMGNAKRTNKFLPDPKINGAKAYTSDYTNTGYDRGHMVPAADMKWSRQAMEESFYLSNICPQNKNLNRGDWGELEELTRTLAKKYDKIYITCGPIYNNKNPKRIGNNKIAVPDAFYKVILIYDGNFPKAYGFIFMNKAGSRSLDKYLVTVDHIEEQTGIDFMPNLPKSIQDKIEAEVHYSIPN